MTTPPLWSSNDATSAVTKFQHPRGQRLNTSLGLVTFVFIADNSWDNTQATWLDQAMATADSAAKYTIVVRHHPEGDSSVSTNGESMAIVRNHKFALFLSGHSHLYKHMTTDNARDLVMGNGGAPLIAGGAFFGFAMVDQTAGGQLQLSIYDLEQQRAARRRVERRAEFLELVLGEPGRWLAASCWPGPSCKSRRRLNRADSRIVLIRDEEGVAAP